MKNITMKLNIIKSNLNRSWINIKFNIKNFLVIIISNILYIIIMTIAFILWLIINIFGLIAFIYVTIKNINIKDIKIKVINIIKDIKNKILNLAKNLKMFIVDGYNKNRSLIKSRLNQDCFGKRFITRILTTLNRYKAASHFKFTRDILPLITLILGKIYFLSIVYISLSGIADYF